MAMNVIINMPSLHAVFENVCSHFLHATRTLRCFMLCSLCMVFLGQACVPCADDILKTFYEL
jgi:hypothetical protein